MKQCLHRALLLLLAITGSPLLEADPVELTAEEQRWIASHPVLRVGVVEALIPFEYLKDGRLQGRSKQYLEIVTAATGLQFKYVPGASKEIREQMLVNGQVDILSSYLHFRSVPANAAFKTLTYHTTPPIIVTRIDRADIFDLDQLHGQTVMIPDVEHYEQMFRERSIQANLIKSTSALVMLSKVKEGSADAVVASETFLMPYLYRQFQGVLGVSGVAGRQMLDVSMAVGADQVVLISILGKVLESITEEQRKGIYDQWYDELGIDTPTFLSITNHYLHVLILVVLTLVILCALVYRGHRQQHRAVLNEQEKTMFLSVMSHEIRSPMNSVLAALELLGHTRLNEQQRHYANLANSGAAALGRLLDGVLDTPGSVTRQRTLTVEPADVAALVQGVFGLYRLLAREKHLDLRLNIQTNIPLLWLDSLRLTQVLNNLISNAIKFTDTGSVDIIVSFVTSQVDGQQLQIEVCDTGVGIPEVAQASLFRPYAQASQFSKRLGGTGLGLVICQQLVSLMDGSLTLSSEQDVGTRVTIFLPAKVAPKSIVVSGAEATPRLVADNSINILVVEDALANQEVLRAQISAFGCRSVVAADAAQAMALFKERAYDLILVDCDLPDQDGYSLVCRLRTFELQSGRKRCPIIAISALTGEQHLQRCLNSGMDAVMSKPISLGQLGEAIERWCDVRLASPSANLITPMLDRTTINREMVSDLGSLIKALALCDRPTALHVAHRLHGAALGMGWAAMGQAAARMERLLREEKGWSSPLYAESLRALLQHWQTLSGDAPLDVLSGHIG
ncbi:TPA: response regulator [Pseudomonas aeruginosa]|nr:response regulator [Pseudomonas aeruginosa]